MLDTTILWEKKTERVETWRGPTHSFAVRCCINLNPLGLSDGTYESLYGAIATARDCNTKKTGSSGP